MHEARAARSLLAELTRLREILREEVRERAERARETYQVAREEGTARITAGLAALWAAAHRQGIEHGPRHGQEHGPARGLAHGPAPGEERGRDAWQERQAREASRESIKERLGRITGREEVPRHTQEGPAAGLSAHGLNRPDQERSLSIKAIRERLEALRERAQPGTRPGAQREAPATGLSARDQGHGREHEGSREAAHGATYGAHEPDPINAQLRALLARQEAAAERHGPVARLVERARSAPANARSFPTPQEAHAFREEMERRFDPDTLARLGRGEERALAQIAGNKLDGLRVARAHLDSRGEPERSEARLKLTYGIVDAQHEAQRERQAYQLKGHSWGL